MEIPTSYPSWVKEDEMPIDRSKRVTGLDRRYRLRSRGGLIHFSIANDAVDERCGLTI